MASLLAIVGKIDCIYIHIFITIPIYTFMCIYVCVFINFSLCHELHFCISHYTILINLLCPTLTLLPAVNSNVLCLRCSTVWKGSGTWAAVAIPYSNFHISSLKRPWFKVGAHTYIHIWYAYIFVHSYVSSIFVVYILLQIYTYILLCLQFWVCFLATSQLIFAFSYFALHKCFTGCQVSRCFV